MKKAHGKFIKGHAERADISFFKAEDNYKHEPTVDEKVKLMTDNTSAGINGLAKVYGKDKTQRDVCHTHSAIRWFSKHKGKFRCKESTSWKPPKKRRGKVVKSKDCNLSRMYDDLRRYRTMPNIKLVKHAGKLMMIKWKKKYKEKSVADAWGDVWLKTRITRIERNYDQPLKGGLPCDNNICERWNRTDKFSLKHYRFRSIDQFYESMKKRVAEVSAGDLIFCKQMKPKVSSRDFYRQADEILRRYESNLAANNAARRDHEYLPNSLDLHFAYSNAVNNIPTGSFIVVSGRGIQALEQYFDDNNLPHNNARLWRNGIIHPIKGKKDDVPWLKLFKTCIETPEAIENNYKDFDEMLDLLDMFLLCQPIDPRKDQQSHNAARTLHQMLKRAGVPIIPWEELKELGNKGLLTCSCGTWLHCTWCKHSHASAVHRKIIKDPYYPKLRNPRTGSVIQNISKGGRPRKKHGRRCLVLPRTDNDDDDDLSVDSALSAEDDDDSVVLELEEEDEERASVPADDADAAGDAEEEDDGEDNEKEEEDDGEDNEKDSKPSSAEERDLLEASKRTGG